MLLQYTSLIECIVQWIEDKIGELTYPFHLLLNCQMKIKLDQVYLLSFLVLKVAGRSQDARKVAGQQNLWSKLLRLWMIVNLYLDLQQGSTIYRHLLLVIIDMDELQQGRKVKK